jgi:hypothetical protein
LLIFCFQQIIDPAVVGQYDAVVVHADNAAVEFFQKYGFSDDIVLNSRCIKRLQCICRHYNVFIVGFIIL